MAFPSGWGYRWPISINADSVIAAPVTDWPCLITDVHFPAEAWAHMNADGSDLRFSLDEEGTVGLYFDLVRIDVAGQSAHIYVRVPTLSSTTDTVIYAWVGNEEAAAPSAAWMQGTYPSEWLHFWPMEEGSGDTIYDRTANANHGTLTNMDPATAWVQAPDGSYYLTFDGSNDRVSLTDTGSSPTLPGAVLARVERVDTNSDHIFYDSGGEAVYSGLRVQFSSSLGFAFTYGDGQGGSSAYRRSAIATGVADVGWRNTACYAAGYDDFGLYCDGLDVGGTYSGTATTYNPGALPGVIGYDPVYFAHHRGGIAHIAVLTASISADQAAVHHLEYSDPTTWASAGDVVTLVSHGSDTSHHSFFVMFE